MEKTAVLNKEIGLFVENNIDSYRAKEDIDFKKLLDMYFNSKGFFVLMDETNSPKGYLDVSDIEQIQKIFSSPGSFTKKISVLIKEDQLKFRTNFAAANMLVRDVLQRLADLNQIFIPVLQGNSLIGRVSKLIMKEKIKKLYDAEI